MMKKKQGYTIKIKQWVEGEEEPPPEIHTAESEEEVDTILVGALTSFMNEKEDKN